MESYFFQTEKLSVGYDGKPLIKEIEIKLNRGQILTLIGPNGAGKSTILKSITRQIKTVGGTVYLEQKEMQKMSDRAISKKLSIVMTERMNTELLTCEDIVSTGRYPYTGTLGILSEEDRRKVTEAMEIVHALELRDRDFSAISDGQRQRILLARAICQEPEIIVLDEPTSFLDVRYKLELLAILERMARKKHITVIMSLHEIDLAQKVSDKIICVKGDTIAHYGKPEEVFKEDTIRSLYEIDNGSFDPVFGSIELPKIEGEPEVFVISSGGSGIPIYRQLQKEHIPFAAGILYKNDIDYQLARLLAVEVITEEPFRQISDETFARAVEVMKKCKRVIVTDVPVGECNKRVEELIKLAK